LAPVKTDPTTEKTNVELTIREATLPSKLQDWRAKLRTKAKQEKHDCFYSLYGLIRHPETVRAAWAQVRAKRGGPGVDGESIEQIEKEGEEAFVQKLVKELEEKSYRSGAVRRVYIAQSQREVAALGHPQCARSGRASSSAADP
jgi:RNA-directed DNA polymerase